jgi:DNA-binding response OmpR family regulator
MVIARHPYHASPFTSWLQTRYDTFTESAAASGSLAVVDAAVDGNIVRVGKLEVRPDEFSAAADGVVLSLTARELDLLTALARRASRIVSRQELYAVVWGGDYDKSDRSVDVYIAKLRAKLEAALPDWAYIHTHFGFGYRLAAERRSGSGDPTPKAGPSPASQVVHDSSTPR